MRRFLLVSVLLLSACGSFLPVTETTPQTDAMPYFTASTASLAPPVARIVGPVEGHSCLSNPLTDSAATEQAALSQLKARALAIGANGLVDVTFARAGTSLGTNCWQSVTASGTAVVFR